MNPKDDTEDLSRRLHRDLMDAYDEELEMELEDRAIVGHDADGQPQFVHEDKAVRMSYFRELFRLQGELVKLQDWVVATGHKVVIIFEGARCGR